MKIFLRTFNRDINSKSGIPLPINAPRRGTPEWLEFETMLKRSLVSLGHELVEQPENPNEFDNDFGCDKRIYVHKCRRDIPNGNLFWMQMHLRHLFTLDPVGWGADHSGVNNFYPDYIDESDSAEFSQKLSDDLWASGLSKCEQPPISDCSATPSTPFILVPVQIPRDYTIRHHSPVTVKYFIDSVQAWAVETGNHVAFKLHPFNKYDIDLESAITTAVQGSRYVHKVTGNIHELIRRSSGLFVINSGTGFEGLIHGKPVCTFGNCDYNRATLNADLRRLDEARNFIYSYKEDFRVIGYKYVYWYHTKHAYDVRDAATETRLTEYLRGAL